ncbi:hypothetical protein WME95_10795 [Sorangium sp. So ce327]|jgi:hypothetical protein|uniref:hypothetical protein n=1 Tax=unclassified Sorangium TaxID=2621164 RepID=UPI003F5DA106
MKDKVRLRARNAQRTQVGSRRPDPGSYPPRCAGEANMLGPFREAPLQVYAAGRRPWDFGAISDPSLETVVG